MMDSKPLVALDFDGTLVDCKAKQIYALRCALDRHKVSFDAVEAFWNAKRSGAPTIAALQQHGLTPADAAAVSVTWIDLVETPRACEQDKLFPGVLDALDDLAPHARLMVLSARRDPKILENQLRELGLAAYLSAWETVSPGKGAAAAKAARLGTLGARFFVGDTESDLAASSAAKVPFYLLSTGQRNADFFRTREDFSNFHPIYDSFRDVVKELKHELLR
ncbi:HAD family hydrolase [Burkholderia gladioli]|uniref:HAD family hydrolase n=1 Tax=Burkholderia gladioli TaxID=28095 RepID=UPI001640260C|nr:HAD family hydrolase [Burkholderia gladioli]